MRSRRVGWFVGIGAWLVASMAAAEPSPARLSLRWAAPDECPDDVQLVREIEALLGERLPDSEQQPALTVRVNVQGNAGLGYAAKVSFVSQQGAEDRYLEHPSCQELAHALALMVALAIDPERVRVTQHTRDAQTDTAPQAAPPAESVPIPARAAAHPAAATVSRRAMPPSRTRAERQWFRGVRLALEGVAGAGPLPNLALGLQSGLGWQRESFRAEAIGRYWFPRQEAVSFAPSATLELRLATLGARGCWLTRRHTWQLSACAGAEIGDLRGSGQGGVKHPRTRDARYSAVSTGLELAYSRARLAPVGGLELSRALERPPFGVSIDGRGSQVFSPAAWGFCAFFGLALEL